MRNDRNAFPSSLARLLRFLALYGLAVIVVLWLLPSAGAFLQSLYDGLDVATRYALVAALLATLLGQGLAHYRRLRRARSFEPAAPNTTEASS